MARYDYTTDLSSWFGGMTDRVICLVPDFECQVEVYINDTGDDLEMYCTGVFIDGCDMSHGNDIAKAISSHVIKKVDLDLAYESSLFERIRDEEGYYFDGNPGDPDACWRQH